MNLSDLIRQAKQRGFTHNFGADFDHESRAGFLRDAAGRVVAADAVDAGTDPGDDATLYLIETTSGVRGYLALSDSFHADPRKAAFVDRLKGPKS